MERGARDTAELSGVRWRAAVLGRFARLTCLLWLLGVAWLSGASEAASSPAAVPARPLVLQVYVEEGCPHCAAARRFLQRLQHERPTWRVEYRPIDRDPAAAQAFLDLALANGVWPPGVPAFAVDGRLLAMGFDDEAHAGRAIVAMLDAAALAHAIADAGEAARRPASAGEDAGASAAGRANAATPAPPSVQAVDSALFGSLSASRLGLPLFTLALGLLDGFNPCAMWVLLFLLSVLVRLQDRRRMAFVAGTFVFVSAAVYYAFMAAWLNIFLAIGWTRPLRWVLGAVAVAIGAINVKDFFAWGRGPTLAIPDRAKPGLVARMRRAMQAPGLRASMLAVAALAVVVNFVELLCTAGLPAIFTAVLAQHELSAAAHHAYLGLYILGYIADDALMVGVAVAALSSGKLGERGGRWLKFVSGAVMLGLGAVLLLRPQWLM
jgi:glutaredoxin